MVQWTPFALHHWVLLNTPNGDMNEKGILSGVQTEKISTITFPFLPSSIKRKSIPLYPYLFFSFSFFHLLPNAPQRFVVKYQQLCVKKLYRS